MLNTELSHQKIFSKSDSVEIDTSKYLSRSDGRWLHSSKQNPDWKTKTNNYVFEQDEPDILLDLRVLNGKLSSTKYDQFWDEIQELFSEYETAVHERHHGNQSYLPFTISVRELVKRVKSHKPNIDVLSAEWVRLQFSPQNPIHCQY